MVYEKRDAAFSKFMDEEHPHHDVYDHESKIAYESWQAELKTAFNAGWKARKLEVDYAGLTKRYSKARG